MNLKPLQDRVVVRRLPGETLRPSGIVIPETAAEKPEQGEVVAAGPGRMLDNGSRLPMCIAPGDRVLFGKYGSQTVKVDGEELLVMTEGDILAIVTGA